MPGYDTSPGGQAAAAAKQAADLARDKAGSAKGASGTYQDVRNRGVADEGTIARNQINSHTSPTSLKGSTGDLSREKA